jgi:hypothetical protein
MADIRWERYPKVAGNETTRVWLRIGANLGLAPNTIDAYARALEDYLAFSAQTHTDILTANREHIAVYVHDLSSRKNSRAGNVVVIDSGVGLANATLQQRLTAIRLFYDYLIEEGHRMSNPVGRGRYTPGRCFGGARERGLLPRYTKLPWIPNDEQWRAIIEAARREALRNRLMLAPTPPCSTARSVSSRIRFLSSALNLRRSGFAGTSGSGELATKGIATLASLTMILLAALLCNYGRGKCLIDVGTEGLAK